MSSPERPNPEQQKEHEIRELERKDNMRCTEKFLNKIFSDLDLTEKQKEEIKKHVENEDNFGEWKQFNGNEVTLDIEKCKVSDTQLDLVFVSEIEGFGKYDMPRTIPLSGSNE